MTLFHRNIRPSLAPVAGRVMLAGLLAAGMAACTSTPAQPTPVQPPVLPAPGGGATTFGTIIIPTGDPTSWPTPTLGDDDQPQDDDGAAGPAADPTWDDQSRQAAVAAAAAALVAYGQPSLDYQTWITQLGAHMDPAALDRYRLVDPSNIPIHTVDTASCQLVDDTSGWIGRVNCGTDAGVWQVMVSRTGQADLWVAQEFLPPGVW